MASKSSDLSPNEELVEFWRKEPAPLLPLLHAFHDRDGFLSDEALEAIAKGLRIPLADLYGTVTFYHHFSRTPNGLGAPRVCTGPVCRLRGAREMHAALEKDGGTAMHRSPSCVDTRSSSVRRPTRSRPKLRRWFP